MAVDGDIGAARPVLDRLAGRGPAYVLLPVAAVGPLLAGLPTELELLPFVLSLVVLGMPHGAVDHLVPWRVDGTTLARSLVAVGVVYGLLMAAYYAAWTVAPSAAFVGFIALTWFHWGQGDVYALLAVVGVDHLRTRAERALALVVRGGLPMLVPLLGHPGEYRRVADALVSLFDPGGAAALEPLFAVDARAGLGAGFAAVTLASLGTGYRHVRAGVASERGWRRDAAEVGLLWAFFLLVPPIVAVGLYFCLWHAVRHIARLAASDRRSLAALAGGDVRTPALRFARDAAPTTAGGLAVVAGIYLAAGRPAGPDALLGAYLVAIAVLTLPHVVVVTWMDRKQGVWEPGGSGRAGT